MSKEQIFLNPAEEKLIVEAIAELEKTTSGEVHVHVTAQELITKTIEEGIPQKRCKRE